MANVNHNITFNISAKSDGSVQATMAQMAASFKAMQASVSSGTLKAMQASMAALSKLQVKQEALKSFGQLGQVVQRAHQQMEAAKVQVTQMAAANAAAARKVNETRQRYEDLKRSMQVNKSDLTRQQVQALKLELKDLRGEWKAAEKEQKVAATAYAKSQAEALRQQQALSTAQRQMSQAALRVYQSQGSTANLASQQRQIQAEIQRTNQLLQTQQQIAARQVNYHQSQEQLSGAYQNFQSAMGAAQSILSPFKSAADNAMRYEYELSNVKALTQLQDIRAGNTQKVQSAMADLDKMFRRLGATTEYTMTEVAQGAGYLGMAGWDKNQIQAGMPVFMDLATATRTRGDEFARLMDIISDDMTAAGLKAGQMYTIKSTGRQVESADYFANTFAYALTNSNLNKESLHEGFKYFAPIASELGLSIGEMMGTAMLVANSGIKGSQAGTGFRAGLLRMSAPPRTAAKALTEMGEFASMSDATKQLQEAQDAMKELGVEGGGTFEKIMSISQQLQNFDAEKRLGYIKAIFGQNAATFWTKALSDPEGVKQIGEYVKFMESDQIDGYAKDTASVQRDNTFVQMEILKSSIDAVSNAVGTALLPAMRGFSETLSPMLTDLSEWISANPQVVQGVAAIAAGVSGLMVAGAGISMIAAAANFASSGLMMVVSSLRGLTVAGAVLPAMASSFAAVNAAIMTLPAKIGVVFQAFLNLPSVIMGALRAMMMFAFSPAGVALMALAAIGAAVYANWDSVAPVFSQLASVISGSLSSALATIAPAISRAQAAFSNLISAIGNSGLGEMLAKGFTLALEVAVTVITTIIDLISNAIALIADLASGIMNIGAAIADLNLSSMGDAFMQMANGAVTHGFDAFMAVPRGIAEFVAGGSLSNQSQPPEIGLAAEQISALGAAAQASAESMSNAQTFSAAEQISALGAAAQASAESMSNAQTFSAAEQISALGAAAQASAESMQMGAVNVEAISESAQALGQMQAPVQESAAALEALPATIETSTEALSQSAQSTLTINESIAAFSQSLTSLNESLSLAGETLSTSLTSTVESLSLAGESLSTALTSTVESLSLAGETLSASLTALTEGATGAAAEETALSVAAQAASAATAEMTGAINSASAAAVATAAAITTLGASASAANGGVNALSNASASAAGSVSMLGSAASAAIASMNSAAANIASAAANLPSVAHNAAGGIYNHGAFLTWFAEDSPEAAIPLDGSERSIGLWLKAGEMLGLTPAINSVGGIYHRGNDTDFFTDKSVGRGFNLMQIIKGAAAIGKLLKGDVWNTLKSGVVKKQKYKYDALGNIEGLNGLKDNVITAEDSRAVVAAKKAAQEREAKEKGFKSEKSLGQIWRSAQSVLNQIMTPRGVLAERNTTEQLQAARERMSAQVKQSKTFKALNGVQADTQSVLTPQRQGYGGALSKLMTGDVWGAVKSGINTYRNNQAAPLYTLTQPSMQLIKTAQDASALTHIDENAPHLATLTAFDESATSGAITNAGDMQVSFNVTINTQETAQAIPQIQEDFETKMREWLHERQRRGYM